MKNSAKNWISKLALIFNVKPIFFKKNNEINEIPFWNPINILPKNWNSKFPSNIKSKTFIKKIQFSSSQSISISNSNKTSLKM